MDSILFRFPAASLKDAAFWTILFNRFEVQNPPENHVSGVVNLSIQNSKPQALKPLFVGS